MDKISQRHPSQLVGLLNRWS